MPFVLRSLSFRYAKSESSLTTKHTKIGQAGIHASPINNNVKALETPKKCTYKGKAAHLRQKSSSYIQLSNPNDQEKFLITKSASFQSVPTSNMVSKPNFALNESLKRNGLFNKQKQLNNRRSLSVDQLNIPEELISSIKIEEEAVDPSTRPQKFPNDEIKLRKKTGPNAVRAKTFNYDFTSSTRTNEVKGVTKIIIGDYCCAKVGANNKLFFEDNEIKIVNGLTGKHEVLKHGVEVKQVVLKSDRKCVEVYDCDNGRYELHFDSTKDAKSFADSESFRDNAHNERTPIKTKLLRLLGKRSSREILMEKGILRNEQIFGNTIHNVYQMQRCVPEYLTKSIQLIEKPQNISSMGIYRTSGNLATIQKIRCEVDRGKMSILNDYAEDVDVLTGCVKLFFRELKEPLIPLNISDELLHISDMKPTEVWKIIEKLPKPNFDTLMCLIRHLLNVDEFKEVNKMDIYNLSICWGPSLMFIPESCCNIVVQSANNSKVLELLLTFYKNNPNELGACEAAVYNKVLSHPVENKGSTKKTEIFVKGHKKSSSYNNINVVYDAVLKLVELIETHIKTEGLYKKHGTKVDKVIDKINKRKFNELHKYHVHDFTSALKKYVNDLNEPLIPKEIFEEFNCDPFQFNIAKQKIKNNVEKLGRKDTLVVLLRHLVKVTETEKDNKVTFASICDEWKHVLIRTVGQEDAVKVKLLRILMELYGDLQQSEVAAKPMAMPDVIKDIEARSRFSKYDNISATGHQRYDVRGPAKILEEKTDKKNPEY